VKEELRKSDYSCFVLFGDLKRENVEYFENV
jgi:hypothetical protein